MKRLLVIQIFLSLVLGTTYAQEVDSLRAERIDQITQKRTVVELLEQRMDSLDRVISDVRLQYRNQPESREQLTQQLVSAESEFFSLRKEFKVLKSALDALEQELALEELSLKSQNSTEEQVVEEPTDPMTLSKSRNFVDNGCFEYALKAEDLESLKRAQEMEREAATMVDRFAELYTSLIELHNQYQVVSEQKQADDLYDKINSTIDSCDEVDAQLDMVWSKIFDEKSYAYSYFMERMNLIDLLDSQIESLSAAQRDSESKVGLYASDALAAYIIQKRSLVDCERDIAKRMELSEALDSLNTESAYLASIDYSLPRIEIERKYLLEYEAVSFSQKPKYTAYNIPKVKIYDHGTIYRVRLGSYRSRQLISIFKNVLPLYVQHIDGQYKYYTGGFATKVEARLCVEMLRKKGFKNPVVVEWCDAQMRDVPETEQDSQWRVEISGTQSLSDEVKSVIKSSAPGCEIARVGSTFVVSSFVDRALSESVARKIREQDGTLKVEIVEINK